MFDGEPPAWAVFGIVAGLIFYSRFYVQWIASEIRRESVVPEAFWYQSAVGSVMLLLWAFHIQSPLGALSQSVNIIPYTRNLIHIWREKGRLTTAINVVANGLALAIALGAVVVVAWVWRREYNMVADDGGQAGRTWFWLGVGMTGQALFGSRFLIQWIVTEAKRKSVVPTVFWYISLVAAILQIMSFAQRQEWVYTIGLGATLLIYGRNIWFIHKGRSDAVLSEKRS